MATSSGLRNDTDKQKYESVGLRFRHVYSIHDIRTMRTDDLGETVWLLKLRNPWGTYVWTGRWSAWCSEWRRNPLMKIALAPNAAEGTFWISYQDFKR